MFKAVSSKLEMPALEQEMIELWRERSTMARYLARNEASERRWSFLDGPITANNPMGVHHAWGRTYKDLFQRYHTMLGERQRYQNGFDCQGLWIEVEAEKELGFKNKRDIEAYGIDRFVEFCKARTQRFADRITEQSIRLGMWMDWDHSYYTNSDENNYAIWAFLAECHRARPDLPRPRRHAVVPALRHRPVEHGAGDRGLPRADAPLADRPPADHERRPRGRGPAGLDDDAVDALLERGRRRPPGAHLRAGRGPRRAPLVAQPRLAAARRSRRDRRPRGARARARGADLQRARSTSCRRRRAWSTAVITWDEVSDEEGTGIVHIAPGCGQEDFALSKQFDLAVIDPIDEFGRFKEGFGWQSGRYAGADDPDGADLAREVAEDLEGKGLLVAREQYRHSYPVCWRCGTQVVFRLVDEWFIAMDPLRAELGDSTGRADLAAAGHRPGGARARLAPEHVRLDDQQEALLRPGAADLDLRATATPGRSSSRATSCGSARSRAGRRSTATRRIGLGRRGGDRVRSCGGRSRRIADVGNPWLDAGIVGISTLSWTDRPRLLAGVVSGRPRDRVVPGPVPQLVLRAITESDGDDRPGAVHARSSAMRCCATSTARRCTRARATRSGSTKRPSRSAPT